MRRSKSTGPEEVSVLPSLYHEQHSLSCAVKQKRILTSSYSKAIKKANICVHRSKAHAAKNYTNFAIFSTTLDYSCRNANNETRDEFQKIHEQVRDGWL